MCLQIHTLVICWTNLYKIMHLKTHLLKCLLSENVMGSFHYLWAKKSLSSPTAERSLPAFMGFWSQVTEALVCLGLNYVLDIITERSLMKCFNELLISWQNETFYRTSRQSTNLKSGRLLEKTCNRCISVSKQDDVLIWEPDGSNLGISHSWNLFHGPLSMSLAVNYYFHHPSKYSPGFAGSFMSPFPPPWPQYNLNWIEFKRVILWHIWLLWWATSLETATTVFL